VTARRSALRHRIAAEDAMMIPASSCSVERAFSVLANLKSGHLKDSALADYWGLAVIGRYNEQKRKSEREKMKKMNQENFVVIDHEAQADEDTDTDTD
jgi:hypothetical protein